MKVSGFQVAALGSTGVIFSRLRREPMGISNLNLHNLLFSEEKK